MAPSLDEKMQEYSDAFDDQFPLMMFRGVSETEIIEEIDACLKDGTPYKASNPETLY